MIAGLVCISMLASAALSFACERLAWTWFTEGFRIVALTVIISLGAAILFPVSEQKEQAQEEVSA